LGFLQTQSLTSLIEGLMKLYHYATTKLTELKTLEKQGAVDAKLRADARDWYNTFKRDYGVIRPGMYYQHISFFFEPIPLNIPSYFKSTHDVWVKGKILHEHVVESDSVGVFGYEIAEPPVKTELYYDESLSVEGYHKKLTEMYATGDYMGNGSAELEQAYAKLQLQGKAEEYFKLLPSRPNYDQIGMKYAATVPHLMLYPATGVVDVQSSRKIVLK